MMHLSIGIISRSSYDIYGHLMPQAKREASVKLAKPFLKKPSPKNRLLEPEPETGVAERVN
jgi:hypothetical protein